MDEQTTTDTSSVDEGANALPSTQTDDAAVTSTNDSSASSTSEDKGGETPLPKVEVDEKLISFAKGQGVDNLEGLSDREISLIKLAYDSKADRDRMRNETTSVESAMVSPATDQTDLAAKVQYLENVEKVRDFFSKNPEAEQHRADIAEYLNSNSDKQQLVEAGYLSLSDVYTLFQRDTGVISRKEEQAKADGGKEALTTLANKQQAVSPRGNATTSAPSASVTKENFDTWYSGLSAAERSKPENQAIVSRMLS